MISSLCPHSLLDKQRSLRIATVLVGYSEHDTVYSLGAVDLLAEILSIQCKVLVWNNNLVPNAIARLVDDGWIVHLGSNMNHEFSGWQEGLSMLPNTISSYDYLIFANDSLARSFSDTRRSLLLSSLVSVINSRIHGKALGLIHYPSNECGFLDIDGFRIRSWLCTGFFALPGICIDRLNGVIDYSFMVESLIPCTGNSLLKQTCPASTRLHIDRWLTDEVNGWYGALSSPHNERDLALLRNKAKMILNELMLTASLLRAGIALYDPTVCSNSTASNSLVRLLHRSFLAFSRLFRCHSLARQP